MRCTTAAGVLILLAAFLLPLIPHQPAMAATTSVDGWEWQNPLPDGRFFQGIWGSSSTDVFVVGQDGALLHYDGTSWAEMSSGTTLGLYGVSGSSPSDVHVVGESGVALHYDGDSWSALSSGTSDMLVDVWCASETEAFAGGDRGTILHYDGSGWSPMTSGTNILLKGIWGSSADSIFVIGDEGTILHYDGASWSPMTSGSNAYFWPFILFITRLLDLFHQFYISHNAPPINAKVPKWSFRSETTGVVLADTTHFGTSGQY